MLEQVETWLFEGRLADPFEEFFVAMSKDLTMSEDSIWQSKFMIEALKQTYYINAAVAQQASRSFVCPRAILLIHLSRTCR